MLPRTGPRPGWRAARSGRRRRLVSGGSGGCARAPASTRTIELSTFPAVDSVLLPVAEVPKHALAPRRSGRRAPDAGDLPTTRPRRLAARAAGRSGHRPGPRPDSRSATTGAARRAEQRAERVAAGLAELDLWLRDHVRAGLSVTSGGAYRHAEQVAARMVDAQAGRGGRCAAQPGRTGHPGPGGGGAGRLRPAAPADPRLRADPRARCRRGSRRWCGRSRLPVPGRACLPGGQRPVAGAGRAGRAGRPGPGPADPPRARTPPGSRAAAVLRPAGPVRRVDAALRPGTALDADLHFYPGQPPLRALIGGAPRQPGAGPAPPRPGGIQRCWRTGRPPWPSTVATRWPAPGSSAIPVPGAAAR